MPSVLDQLRDIHVPPPVSWWPLALGYWLVLLLVLIAACIWFARFNRARTRRLIGKKLELLVEDFQEHGNANQLAQQISVLLRRAAITLGTRQEVASATGKAWIAALEKLAAHGNMRFSRPVARTLTRDIYAHQDVQQIEDLIAECRQWVKALPARRSAV